MKSSSVYALAVIILFSFVLKMYFAFGTPTYTEGAYFSIRNVEHILKDGWPMIYDELVGGRFVYPSLFYYFLAVFAFFSRTFAYKIIPELLILTLIPLIYLIVRRLTSDEASSLLGAVIAGFIPTTVYLINEVSVYSLAIPLIFFMFYLILHLNDFFKLSLILAFLFSLVTPLSLLVPAALVLYLIIGYAEKVKFKPFKTKAVIYISFIICFVNLIFYKGVINSFRLNIFWQNIPNGVLSKYFSDLGILNTAYLMGIIPFLFGVAGIALFLSKNKRNSTYMIVGLISIVALAFSFKIIQVKVGLILLSAVLIIPASVAIKSGMDYINITKLSRFKKLMIFVFISLTLVSLIAPSFTIADRYARQTVKSPELSALEWMKVKTGNDALILASPLEAHMITSLAERKVLFDNYYLTQEKADEIYNDTEEMYITKSYVKFTNQLSKYKIDYIYFSDRTRRFYDIPFLEMADTHPSCFIPVYSNDRIIIYKVECVK